MNTKKSNDPRDQSRVSYWNNDYVRYWEARVAEANSGKPDYSKIVIGDTAATGNARYSDAIECLGISSNHRVLELACGFGRSLPVLSRLAAEVDAVDISEQMIEVAKRDFSLHNINFHIAPSEDMSFGDNKFDRIVCFAAFDAMFQTEALIEMHRVCKMGGRILLTGKNDNYHPDDYMAYEAELGARSKGHPNYFTDFERLTLDLRVFGLRLIHAEYYERRGDFANGTASQKKPDHFYEYLLVLEKNGPCAPFMDIIYYDAISKTCKSLHQIDSLNRDDRV